MDLLTGLFTTAFLAGGVLALAAIFAVPRLTTLEAQFNTNTPVPTAHLMPSRTRTPPPTRTTS